jgi:hypothetical protein
MPNWEQAFVEPAKLEDYLLNFEHPTGGTKARFLLSLGYRRDAWRLLRDDMLTQLANLDFVDEEITAYGHKFVIVGQLAGPVSTGTVRRVWILLRGADRPRLVTAYPG